MHIYINIYIYIYVYVYNVNYIDSTFRRICAVPMSVMLFFKVLLKTELQGSAKHN